MANYAINYARPAKSLLKLRDELNAVFPGRFTGTDGFITGYDSQANPRYGVSGHNPNSLGHVMAFDISTTANGLQIDEAAGRALAEYLRTKAYEKFRYLIHDMSAGAPDGKIAGDFSQWAWSDYAGVDHSDHIHLSITDDYQWGESCGTTQAVYDDESSWGIAAWWAAFKAGAAAPVVKPAGSVVKPVPVNPAPARPNTFVATVDPGDTLTSIAQQFGTTVAALLAVNTIPDPNRISAGQKMNIPRTPAAKPQPAPAKPAPAPAPALVNRIVTNPVAWVRTAPRSGAPLAPGYPRGIPKGQPIAVKGFVVGENPYGTTPPDNAWYVTKSGYYVWANAAQNTIAGLRNLT
ncbi:LysM domain-containing protein [Arthrobacter sp. SDTb3-6]|uniref:LysM peptidoglycan-binding domain-containing protein n=1 Tax=Arthrobacter sp. SDTb3-6 TaxID=2713571 RepID=UPI00159DE197|nr:LysM domain-containing protein [Arthrobacter sp. SDTb3-6]NVM97839.1 LysM peptidoglycan-binding domain-containing protein [Arthrobacter sp. SDTb3-6]